MHFLLVTMPLIPLAFMEELAFRGYPLEILKNRIGIRASIFITSILFALYHLANGWTIESSFLGPAIWGLIFGLAAIYSKGIAMPTGIHYAANLTASHLDQASNTTSIMDCKSVRTDRINQPGTNLMTIIPNLALLVFAITCISITCAEELISKGPFFFSNSHQ